MVTQDLNKKWKGKERQQKSELILYELNIK